MYFVETLSADSFILGRHDWKNGRAKPPKANQMEIYDRFCNVRMILHLRLKIL